MRPYARLVAAQGVKLTGIPARDCRGDSVIPLAKIGPKGRVTIPAPIRSALALEEGDYVEVTSDGRTIVLTPKAMVVPDPAIDEALADVKDGRVTPSFSSVETLVAHLDRRGED